VGGGAAWGRPKAGAAALFEAGDLWKPPSSSPGWRSAGRKVALGTRRWATGAGSPLGEAVDQELVAVGETPLRRAGDLRVSVSRGTAVRGMPDRCGRGHARVPSPGAFRPTVEASTQE
jgi:hypothetical protein